MPVGEGLHGSEVMATAEVERAVRRRRFGPAAIVLGLGGATAMILEVGNGDWAAFRLSVDFDSSAGVASAAFLLMTIGMTVGRLGGDWVQVRVGSMQLRRLGVSIAGIGSILATLVPVEAVSLFGFLVAGLGTSVLFPQLYDQAARLPGPPGSGFAAMLIGQRSTGIIIPIVIGSLANTARFGVGQAMAVVLIPAAIVGLAITYVRLPPPPSNTSSSTGWPRIDTLFEKVSRSPVHRLGGPLQSSYASPPRCREVPGPQPLLRTGTGDLRRRRLRPGRAPDRGRRAERPRGQGSSRCFELPGIRDHDHGLKDMTDTLHTPNNDAPTTYVPPGDRPEGHEFWERSPYDPADYGPVTDFATDFDHGSAEYNAKAPEVWKELRESGCPVAHSERYGGMWVPLTHDTVHDVAYDTDNFTSRAVVVSTTRPGDLALPAPIGGAPPITSDPPFHGVARRILLPPFAPKQIEPWEDEIRAAVPAAARRDGRDRPRRDGHRRRRPVRPEHPGQRDRSDARLPR